MADWATIAAAIFGVLVGGALKALESRHERAKRAEAVLTTLVAEVDTIRRLINGREYIKHLVEFGNYCREVIAAGRADEIVPVILIPVRENYFAAFDALIDQIGLLHPYQADRIVRFYMLLKSAKEDFSETSLWTTRPVSAQDALKAVESNLMIMRVAYQLGDTIAGFVDRSPPKGRIDPLLTGAVQFPEDPLYLQIDSGFLQNVVSPELAKRAG